MADVSGMPMGVTPPCDSLADLFGVYVADSPSCDPMAYNTPKAQWVAAKSDGSIGIPVVDAPPKITNPAEVLSTSWTFVPSPTNSPSGFTSF